MLGKLDIYRNLDELPLPGETVECMMTVDELLKTDKLFQVMCDLTCPVPQNIPLLPLKKDKQMFPYPVSQTTYILPSPEFIEVIKQGYKCH